MCQELRGLDKQDVGEYGWRFKGRTTWPLCLSLSCSQPVEACNQKHVAGVELVEQPAKQDAIGLRAAGCLAVNLRRAGRAQLLHLSVDALALRADARVAVDRGVRRSASVTAAGLCPITRR